MDTRRNRSEKRWGLNHCEEIYQHPTKAVFLAELEQFGPVILDLPRFLLNEPDTNHASPDREHIQEAIGLVAWHTGYPEADIRKLFYMETVLENVWRTEEFKNRKLEVLVFPMEEQEPEKTDIESVVKSLIGAIPATDMSLEEMREERRINCHKESQGL